MFRMMLCSLVAFGLCVGLASAADKKADKAKDSKEAKITKVDAKKGTVDVKMTDDKGKEVTKTFKLAEDIEYVDSTGKVATIDIFTSGDMVLYVEEDGQLKMLQNKDKPAKK
jgi:cytochrome oxidase Cu insertion factor (SCO1/SenC/PrrC family)